MFEEFEDAPASSGIRKPLKKQTPAAGAAAPITAAAVPHQAAQLGDQHAAPTPPEVPASAVTDAAFAYDEVYDDLQQVGGSQDRLLRHRLLLRQHQHSASDGGGSAISSKFASGISQARMQRALDRDDAVADKHQAERAAEAGDANLAAVDRAMGTFTTATYKARLDARKKQSAEFDADDSTVAPQANGSSAAAGVVFHRRPGGSQRVRGAGTAQLAQAAAAAEEHRLQRNVVDDYFEALLGQGDGDEADRLNNSTAAAAIVADNAVEDVSTADVDTHNGTAPTTNGGLSHTRDDATLTMPAASSAGDAPAGVTQEVSSTAQTGTGGGNKVPSTDYEAVLAGVATARRFQRQAHAQRRLPAGVLADAGRAFDQLRGEVDAIMLGGQPA